MKKIIMIAGLAILTSCGNNSSEKNSESGILDSMFSSNDAPKCDDPEVLETVLSILEENKNELRTNRGDLFYTTRVINNETAEITNILTKSKDDELKSCDCEGTLYLKNLDNKIFANGNVSYFTQINSKGETIVQINVAGPMEYKVQ